MIFYRKNTYDEALKIFLKIYNKFQILVLNHYCIFIAKNNIPLVLTTQGKYDKVMILSKEVFHFQEVNLGKEHYDTMGIKENITIIFLSQKKYKETLIFMHDIYKQYQRILGSDNLNILKIKKELKYVLLIAIDNDYVKEIKHFFERITNIMIKSFQSR